MKYIIAIIGNDNDVAARTISTDDLSSDCDRNDDGYIDVHNDIIDITMMIM